MPREESIRSSLTSMALLVCLGCQGTIGDAGGAPETAVRNLPERTPDTCSGEACEDVDEQPAPVTRIPRLSHLQWESTVQDLFGLEAPTGLSTDFDPDVSLASEFSSAHARLVVSAGLWRDYQRAAEAVATLVVQSPTFEGWRGEADFEDFLPSFGRRVLRRPLLDEERESFRRLYEAGPTHYPALDAERAGWRVLVEALLQSPSFLYRVELTPAEDEYVELDGYELASRLSYFLWGTGPDEALLSAAEDGLSEPRLREQAQRLLGDPRVLATVDLFHAEHFSMNTWRDGTRSAENYPLWRPGLDDEMRRSAFAFVRSVFERDEGLGDLFTKRRAFIGEELAAIYGVEGVEGSDLREVELPPERAGLLTRAGFLTRYASEETDPVHRGLFVHTQVLCQSIPAPPANFDIPAKMESQTTREAVEAVTHAPDCAICHERQINPPGFALEGFDAIGEFRREDNGRPVDTVSTYSINSGDVLELRDAVSLSQQVAERPEAHRCYAQKLIEFALGRPGAGVDAPLVYRLSQESLRGELSLRALLLEIVMSRSFRFRTRAEVGDSE